MEEHLRIMGIDPGTNYMGYGIIEIRDGKPLAVVMGDIDLHKIADAHQKLRYIFERVLHNLLHPSQFSLNNASLKSFPHCRSFDYSRG